MSAVLERMDTLVSEWGLADRRCLFAGAYRTMSANMLEAIESGEFSDEDWVDYLLADFATYYFDAVDAYEGRLPDCPKVWNVAFEATGDDGVHPLRVLFLGINAHINYDLALCVADVMSDWSTLDPTHREIRRRDYDRVDQIIRRTIDSVQEGIVAPAAPAMGVLDKLMGPIDEWLISALIANWRHDTWGDALALLDSTIDQVGQVRAKIESQALSTADWIIHVGPD